MNDPVTFLIFDAAEEHQPDHWVLEHRSGANMSCHIPYFGNQKHRFFLIGKKDENGEQVIYTVLPH
jgi:hypothetical protein